MSAPERVNQAIWLITTGAREAAFRNVKTIAECLADELINAAKAPPTRTPSRRMSSSAWPRRTAKGAVFAFGVFGGRGGRA